MTAHLDHVKHRIAEHRIDTIDCGLGDLHGQLRGKRLTAEHFLAVAEDGFGMGDGVFSFDHASAAAETSYTNAATGYPDMRVRPLLDTFRLIPWRPGSAAVLCEALTKHDRLPLPVCPRQALRRLLDDAERDGHQFVAAAELEFYLLDAEHRPWQPGGRCYALASSAAVEPVLRDLRQALTDFGIGVEGSHVEYGAGQVEVNIRPAPALTAADQAMYFKAIVKEMAARHGLRATFMAKPWPTQPGSGMHVHLSLETSCVLFLAGVLGHLPGLIFLSSPTVNAYKRRAEGAFAPVRATWGEDDRRAAVRVLGHGASRRIEYRGAGADANPYLVLAGCVAAGLDGLRRREPPPPTDDPGTLLPRSLPEGLAAFEADATLRQALGPTLATHLAEMARREWGLFLAAVTDWERERYLEFA